LEFVAEFEIACRQDLEEGVPIVFEVEDVVGGLVLDIDVREPLGGEVAGVDSLGLEAFDDDALAVLQVRVEFLL